MQVISTAKELRYINGKLNLSPVGLVPTMGALHEGHISLVEKALSLSPLVIVSIFVNPAQFNDKNDLKNYPRTPEDDLLLLGKVLRENDIVFTPEVKEIYPETDTRKFSFGNLDNVMEALHRPGHFNGVGQVVSRLFDIVKPDIAIFGQKDFQQLAVIKELVRQTGDKVKIIGSPIIRENDGLAMSSRNMLLEPEIRKNAPVIFKTLSAAAEMITGHDIPEIKTFVGKQINNVPGFDIEYFDIADDTELIPVSSRNEMQKGKRYFGCIAVRAGKIRLIDNIEIGLV
ncbi:MAG: pantoate--beta-alanine ligase [Bacteroidetes bacterium GWE2_41_25]|nr:MAG: pantoate--beta-alanine ligase [Bacteroidetes bacterium GWA2_40_15]OFX95516.1 MAG: pantoate--beta-alanine ligase [Bacteroidetes bacterium GWC2_40_22]OFY10273.1 MAG: pantoate--beta-alanine ligase [Bacteroidetes bacterium GWE2_41_25]OFY61754.1 MAG: pantoate--beta-alanine ligase [Bacteroidetes bacterium GWF2_41_9]HBH82888.1 pantoate--beta-alanine ligase [Bacteroidales bacterium]